MKEFLGGENNQEIDKEWVGQEVRVVLVDNGGEMERRGWMVEFVLKEI